MAAAAPAKPRVQLLWLVYLVFFVMGPAFWGDTRSRLLVVLGIALFLPLYALGFRLGGWRALWPIAGMMLLGIAFAPQNPGSSVFFIYAAAVVARLGSEPRAWTALGVITLLIAVIAWQLQPHAFFWVPAVAVSLVVGSANIHEHRVALANRRLRRSQEEVEKLARIAERERIARDLHDLLGHTLSVVILKSELAGRLAERDPARAGVEIRDVERIARQALGEVRSAVAAYRAESLEGELDNAREALTAAGVDLEVEAAPFELAPLQEGVLALALREAVTNVIRHAAARRCRVVIAESEDEVRLEVADDGCGGDAPDGAGLTGMRERVASLGGAVERVSGAGTCLAIRLPAVAGGVG